MKVCFSVHTRPLSRHLLMVFHMNWPKLFQLKGHRENSCKIAVRDVESFRVSLNDSLASYCKESITAQGFQQKCEGAFKLTSIYRCKSTGCHSISVRFGDLQRHEQGRFKWNWCHQMRNTIPEEKHTLWYFTYNFEEKQKMFLVVSFAQIIYSLQDY